MNKLIGITLLIFFFNFASRVNIKFSFSAVDDRDSCDKDSYGSGNEGDYAMMMMILVVMVTLAASKF